ncbi:MAG: tetraacyldisaccharide 4'-kinase [Thermodesulfobacteriota bacterium]
MKRRIEKIVTEIMEGERDEWPLRIPLYLLSCIYSRAVKTRVSLYSRRLLPKKELPCRVISVGNITVGGSGKTPMTIFLADYLKKRGCRSVVVSRGYGNTLKGRIGVVSDGTKTLLTPKKGGDEPYLMARRLKGVPVVVGGDRYSTGLAAVRRFDPHCIILDDGFQHVQLRRDLNILLIDSSRGFGNGHLLPRGILREPLDGIKRADMMMIKENGEEGIAPASGIPKVSFRYRAASLVSLGGEREEVSLLEGKRVIAVAAIANPSSFIETLKKCGAEVLSSLFYSDHHWYGREDIGRIREEAHRLRGSAEMIVTTEKDMVRLGGMASMKRVGLETYALPVEVVIDDMKRLEELLDPLIAEVNADVTGEVK